MENKPNYYGILPANVRYADMPPMAKILYAELTALTQKEGYCYATNKYFANLYGLSSKTISRLFSQLEKNGFIKIELNATKDNIDRRKIYLMGIDVFGGMDKNGKRGMDKNGKRGMDKNVEHNNINNNTINNNIIYNTIPPKTKNDINDFYNVINDLIDNKELNNAMREWINSRLTRKDKITNYAVKLACNKVLKMREDKRLASVEESIINGWKSIYEIKDTSLKDKAREAYIEDVKMKKEKSMNNLEKTDAMFNKVFENQDFKEFIRGNNDNSRSEQLNKNDTRLLPDKENT